MAKPIRRRDVVLCSYDMMRSQCDALFSVPWHVAIFDEVHKLKNKKSGVYMAAGQLDTKLRYGLSGTVSWGEGGSGFL